MPCTTHTLMSLCRGLGTSVLGVIPYAGVDLAIFYTLRAQWMTAHPGSAEGMCNCHFCNAINCNYCLSYLAVKQFGACSLPWCYCYCCVQVMQLPQSTVQQLCCGLSPVEVLVLTDAQCTQQLVTATSCAYQCPFWTLNISAVHIAPHQLELYLSYPNFLLYVVLHYHYYCCQDLM
jgi:hypothetical protein